MKNGKTTNSNNDNFLGLDIRVIGALVLVALLAMWAGPDFLSKLSAPEAMACLRENPRGFVFGHNADSCSDFELEGLNCNGISAQTLTSNKGAYSGTAMVVGNECSIDYNPNKYYYEASCVDEPGCLSPAGGCGGQFSQSTCFVGDLGCLEFAQQCSGQVQVVRCINDQMDFSLQCDYPRENCYKWQGCVEVGQQCSSECWPAGPYCVMQPDGCFDDIGTPCTDECSTAGGCASGTAQCVTQEDGCTDIVACSAGWICSGGDCVPYCADC